jgi:hypothetical protein
MCDCRLGEIYGVDVSGRGQDHEQVGFQGCWSYICRCYTLMKFGEMIDKSDGKSWFTVEISRYSGMHAAWRSGTANAYRELQSEETIDENSV